MVQVTETHLDFKKKIQDVTVKTFFWNLLHNIFVGQFSRVKSKVEVTSPNNVTWKNEEMETVKTAFKTNAKINDWLNAANAFSIL